MIRDSEWFTEEADELLDKWSSEDIGMEYPDYLLKYAGKKQSSLTLIASVTEKKCWEN